MSLDERFNEASKALKELKDTLAEKDYSEIYSYFKQSTIGDVNIELPEVSDPKEKSTWEAWKELKGTAQENAKEKYVALVSALREKKA